MDGVFQKQDILIQGWGEGRNMRGLTGNNTSGWKAPTLRDLIAEIGANEDDATSRGIRPPPRKCYQLIVEEAPHLRTLGTLNSWTTDNSFQYVGKFTNGDVTQYVTQADWPSVKLNKDGLSTTENRFVECPAAGGYRKTRRRRGHFRSKRKSRRT